MKKSAKRMGIVSIFILFGWILFVLIGTSLLEETYSSIGVTQIMLFALSSIICLWFLKWQFLWAIESKADEKTLDNKVSLIPVVAMIISVVGVGFTGLDMGSEKILWITSLILFGFTWWLDFSVGTHIGNSILTLKSVEQRTKE